MHGPGIFNRSGVFYFNDPKTIFDDQWLLDYQKISALKHHDLVVADFSSEHYGVNGLDNIYQALETSGIKFVLLSHDYTDHKKLPRLLHYPHWYYSTLDFEFPEFILNKREYLWSCLNHNPRPHRIYNFILSQEKSYFSRGIFTMFFCDDAEEIGSLRNDDYPIDKPTKRKWQDLKHTLPNCNIPKNFSRFKEFDGKNTSIPAYTNSYIHLVTETTVIPRIFITEKTWKPVAIGQIFLIFGNPGSVEYLRSLGVDMFDDIVNHDYDLIQDWQIRLDKIHEEIEKLIALDLENIYILTESRRNANIEKFKSGHFVTMYEKDITDTIDTFLQE